MLRVLAAVGTLLIAGPSLAKANAPAKGRTTAHNDGSGRPHKDTPAKKPAKCWPAVQLEHMTTHESFVLRPETNGQLAGKRLRGLRHFLRCHHTGREHPISTRLAQVLYQTAHHFGDRPITVIAGYRAPRVARAKGNVHSPHKRGVACDIVVHGVANTALRDYLRSAYPDAGVGYYPHAGFVHVDVGRGQRAFWIDYSGPGERARYSRDPNGDLVSGRAVPDRDGEARDENDDDEGEPGAPTAIADRRAADDADPARQAHRALRSSSGSRSATDDDPGLNRHAEPAHAPRPGSLSDDDEP